MANSQKSIKGTETEKNLGVAYVAESCAYSRYTFFAQTATKESYFQYADIFNETAANELHHAKIFLKYLAEGAVVVDKVGVDAGILAPTVDNLKVAAEEEKKEGVELYTNAADVAEKEGFKEIADRFRAIATIEDRHMKRFNLMRKRIEEGTVWKREKPIKWQCLVCGYISEGTEPPKKCPACCHPYQHFMPIEKNY